jgi:hypothetical protein
MCDQKGRIANTPWTFDTAMFATLNGGGEVLFHHCDDQGTCRAHRRGGQRRRAVRLRRLRLPRFYNAAGELLVDATGQPLRASPSGNPYIFHGLRWDDETGLYQTQARGGRKDMLQWLHDSLDPNTGSTLSRTYAFPHVFDQKSRAYAGNNPHSLKKEEGGRHTPFHNRCSAAHCRAARSFPPPCPASPLAGAGGPAAAYARVRGHAFASRERHRTKQTQGATFGERVNAGRTPGSASPRSARVL